MSASRRLAGDEALPGSNAGAGRDARWRNAVMKVLLALLAVAAVGIGAVVALERRGSDPTDSGEAGSSAPESEGPAVQVLALGDSVTAAFGYHPDGRPVGGTERVRDRQIVRCWVEVERGRRCNLGVFRCVGENAPVSHFDCQSPDVAAYPAVYGELAGLRKAEVKNVAVWGSTPAGWLGRPERGERDLSSRLDHALRLQPSLIVFTLGANPTLAEFVTPGMTGNECFHRAQRDMIGTYLCLRDVGRRDPHDEGRFPNRLKALKRDLVELYTRLLKGTDSRVAVLTYYRAAPYTLLLNAKGKSLGDPLDNIRRAHLLQDELNQAISESVLEVSRRSSEWRSRLQTVDPEGGRYGSFDDHGCAAGEPWVIDYDSCIHPSRKGHLRLAQALAYAYPNPRRRPPARTAAECKTARLAELEPTGPPSQLARDLRRFNGLVLIPCLKSREWPGAPRATNVQELTYEVVIGTNPLDVPGGPKQPGALLSARRGGTTACQPISKLFNCGVFALRGVPVNQTFSASSNIYYWHECNVEFTLFQRGASDRAARAVIASTLPVTRPSCRPEVNQSCPLPNEGGGPYDVVSSGLSCQSAQALISSYIDSCRTQSCRLPSGYRCSTRMTGIESQEINCVSGERRVRWSFGS